MCTRLVWGRLVTLLRREGAEPMVAEMFYRAVVQAILLYGLETWVLLAEMEKKIEGSHKGFLINIMGKRLWRIGGGKWETTGVEVVQKATRMQSTMTYMGRQQETVAQWVELRPISEVCAGEKGYKGGGCRREAWWHQEATETQLRANLEGVSQVS